MRLKLHLQDLQLRLDQIIFQLRGVPFLYTQLTVVGDHVSNDCDQEVDLDVSFRL